MGCTASWLWGAHFSKLKRGNRMLFLMKIVKFSASIMTGLWVRREGRGKGTGDLSPWGPPFLVDRSHRARGRGLSGSEGQRDRTVVGEMSRGRCSPGGTPAPGGHYGVGGCPQIPGSSELWSPAQWSGRAGSGSLFPAGQALTFPPCPPRWGTSPGSHRSGPQSCNSRSGQ